MKYVLARSVMPLAIALALSVPSIAHAKAAACELTPLQLPLFGGTPVAQVADAATPTAHPDVDEAAIRSTLEQYVACINTGDPTLVWAMFSPRWFSTTFADPTVHYLPSFEQMLNGPVIPAGEPLKLDRIDRIAPLPDGRVDVTATFVSGDATWTDTLTLVLMDGTWLIDDVRQGSVATPLPG